MFKFIMWAVILCWIWGGALGIFAAMWIPVCLFFLLLGWLIGWDFRITLIIFAIIIGLQLFKGNEPLFVSSKVEDQPEYFIPCYGQGMEKDLNDEDWYAFPEKASWKWLHNRIHTPKIQNWLKDHNMTESELLQIGRKNTGDWYKERFHPDEPDYVPPQ